MSYKSGPITTARFQQLQTIWSGLFLSPQLYSTTDRLHVGFAVTMQTIYWTSSIFAQKKLFPLDQVTEIKTWIITLHTYNSIVQSIQLLLASYDQIYFGGSPDLAAVLCAWNFVLRDTSIRLVLAPWNPLIRVSEGRIARFYGNQLMKSFSCSFHSPTTSESVADPDLQIKGGPVIQTKKYTCKGGAAPPGVIHLVQFQV